jgi:hypothetical protein
VLELKGRFVARTTNAPASQNHARRTEAVSAVTFRVRLEGARNPHELVCALTLLPFGPCAAFFLTAPKSWKDLPKSRKGASGTSHAPTRNGATGSRLEPGSDVLLISTK